MTDRFSFGLTLKHVTETLAENHMNAFLLDVGTFLLDGFWVLKILCFSY